MLQLLSVVQKLKLLGVEVDENLSWKSRINNTKKKIWKIIALLHKTNKLVHSALFCDSEEIWGNTCKSFTHQLSFEKKQP